MKLWKLWKFFEIGNAQMARLYVRIILILLEKQTAHKIIVVLMFLVVNENSDNVLMKQFLWGIKVGWKFHVVAVFNCLCKQTHCGVKELDRMVCFFFRS